MTSANGAQDEAVPVYPVTVRTFDGEPARYSLLTPEDPAPRVAFGLELLAAALGSAGLTRETTPLGPTDTDALRIIVATRSDERIRRLEDDEVLLYNTAPPEGQGYYLSRLPADIVVVTAIDDSGLLYGLQELAREVRREGRIPLALDGGETPDLVVRGPAIGLQKTTLEPERQTYEYPITPSRFPWFYDRAHWIRVLDELFDQRSNIIYLWSGHPFSSFVELPDYPEALEVTRDELELNRETLNWLLDEADRRGIQLMLHFYNIHIPLTFSRAHGIPLRQPEPTTLVADYTRAAISTFVREYPRMGLYVCLGEVLQGALYGEEWLLETIIPAVDEGSAGLAPDERPPLMLRSHGLDPEKIVEAARRRVPTLYTEAKYNGESLTTWNPRGDWQKQHRMLATKATVHIANVHILADLEPFRYAAFSFIQRSVQAMVHRLDVRGLHLYPLFFWDWPYSPDNVEPRLLQIERDRLWFAAWHRYAWKADRDPAAERRYWNEILAEQFGTAEAGVAVTDLYEAMGQIPPRLLRRVGITEGNRQTFSLGMTMSQHTNSASHRTWPDLWESHAPGGERLELYAEREAAGVGHVGETPVDVAREALMFASQAREAADCARATATRDLEELGRVLSDAEALIEIAQIYALRIEAAVEIAAFREDQLAANVPRLTRASALVDRSIEHYRRLAGIAGPAYLYANSMRTPQRKVPFPNGFDFGHWSQCLPEFEQEAANLAENVRLIERHGMPEVEEIPPQPRFGDIGMRISGEGVERVVIERGARLFSDSDDTVVDLAPEIEGLSGARMPRQIGGDGQLRLRLEMPENGHLLIGYVKGENPNWLRVPSLETDTHADARGGLDPVLRGALDGSGLAAVDVHAFRYEKGEHDVALGAGSFLILGAVAADQPFTGRVVTDERNTQSMLDWLYDEPRVEAVR